ncbi:Uncharacterised protein [Mycobacteroides abscessus subsp. abscessus]|nr:Uncharacterised protein [Mycobacteroides abscessus subsp. abscessus]
MKLNVNDRVESNILCQSEGTVTEIDHEMVHVQWDNGYHGWFSREDDKRLSKLPRG